MLWGSNTAAYFSGGKNNALDQGSFTRLPFVIAEERQGIDAALLIGPQIQSC
jgi:hypothetical protein